MGDPGQAPQPGYDEITVTAPADHTLCHTLQHTRAGCLADVIVTSRRRGEETWVYGRAGRPCRRSGTPVRTAGQGSDPESRVTFWCPHCQT